MLWCKVNFCPFYIIKIEFGNKIKLGIWVIGNKSVFILAFCHNFITKLFFKDLFNGVVTNRPCKIIHKIGVEKLCLFWKYEPSSIFCKVKFAKKNLNFSIYVTPINRIIFLTEIFIVLICREYAMKYGSSNNSATVDVYLKRRLTGIFMTTYMPTILLNIIGHSTKYFKSLYFDAKITVNLTVSSIQSRLRL